MGGRTGDNSGLEHFSSLSFGARSSADVNEDDMEVLRVGRNVNVMVRSQAGAPKRDPLTQDPRIFASDFGIFVRAGHDQSSY